MRDGADPYSVFYLPSRDFIENKVLNSNHLVKIIAALTLRRNELFYDLEALPLLEAFDSPELKRHLCEIHEGDADVLFENRLLLAC